MKAFYDYEHAYRQAVRRGRAIDLEIAECVKLQAFDRIDSLFVAEHPDGSWSIQSWYRKPEWIR